MNSNQRRNEIIKLLSDTTGYINASTLAEMFGVTRQIIVSDIALLRAKGEEIIATKNGYTISSGKSKDGELFAVVCKHGTEQITEEFNIIVDNGGIVENVVVEHPVYGQISADLNIASRYDTREFVRLIEREGAAPLSVLSNGIHIHNIRVPDKERMQRITKELKEANIIYNEV